MVDLWMPGATRHAVGNTGEMDGGPARAVWHITSNDNDWTFGNELGWFTGGGTSVAPHLLWDPFTGQIAQFFPADSRSLSLQNAGAVRTNRTGRYCIQIETVFTENETVDSRRYATVRDTPCKGLDQIMAWLRSLGIPNGWPGGAPTGFVRDTVSLDLWQTRGGHYGHNQIPGNSHVDPGPMPDLFTSTPTEDDMPLTDAEIDKIAARVAGFKNPTLEPKGPDLRQHIVNAEQHGADALAQARTNGSTLTSLSAKVDKASAPALTDAQTAAIADRLASNPAFTQALATALSADLAQRLQS